MRRSEIIFAAAQSGDSSEDSQLVDEEAAAAIRQRRKSQRQSQIFSFLTSKDEETPVEPDFKAPDEAAAPSLNRRRSFLRADNALARGLRRRSGRHGDLMPNDDPPSTASSASVDDVDDPSYSGGSSRPSKKKKAAKTAGPAPAEELPIETNPPIEAESPIQNAEAAEVFEPEAPEDAADVVNTGPPASPPKKKARAAPRRAKKTPAAPRAPRGRKPKTKPQEEPETTAEIEIGDVAHGEEEKTTAETPGNATKVFPLFAGANSNREEPTPKPESPAKEIPQQTEPETLEEEDKEVAETAEEPGPSKKPVFSMFRMPSEQDVPNEAVPPEPEKPAEKKKVAVPRKRKPAPEKAPKAAPARKRATTKAAKAKPAAPTENEDAGPSQAKPETPADPAAVFALFRPSPKEDDANAKEDGGRVLRRGLRVRKQPNRLNETETEAGSPPPKSRRRGPRKDAGKDISMSESSRDGIETLGDSPMKAPPKPRSPSPPRVHVFGSLPQDHAAAHADCAHTNAPLFHPEDPSSEPELDLELPLPRKDFMLDDWVRDSPAAKVYGPLPRLAGHPLRPPTEKAEASFRGNEAAVTVGREWLEGWKARGGGRDEESDDEETGGVLVLSGPLGSGKTALAHALAKELGFGVLELAADSARSARALDAAFRGATDTKRIAAAPSAFFAKPSPAAKPKAKPNNSLILLDDVDIVFEDDDGFWGGVGSMAKESQIPIILTATDPNFRLPVDVPSTVVTLGAPNVRKLAKSSGVDPSAALCASSDPRRLRNHLHFWLHHTADAGTAETDMIGQELDNTKPSTLQKMLRAPDASIADISSLCSLRASLDASASGSGRDSFPGHFRGAKLLPGIGDAQVRAGVDSPQLDLQSILGPEDTSREPSAALSETSSLLGAGGSCEWLSGLRVQGELLGFVGAVCASETRRRSSLEGRDARRFQHHLSRSLGLETPAFDTAGRLSELCQPFPKP